MVEARPPFIEGGLVCQDGLRVPFRLNQSRYGPEQNLVAGRGL